MVQCRPIAKSEPRRTATCECIHVVVIAERERNANIHAFVI